MKLALSLFEKVFDAFPQYRNQLISRMRDQNLWKNERVFALGKRAILPTAREVAATPWFGLNDIYSYSSGGRVNGQFGQMLNGVHGSGRMPELQKAIQDRLEETPGWHGGEAMLALIDLKQNRKEEAKKRLETLVSDEEVFKTIPSNSCWLIGQELDQFEDTRPLAVKLFEVAAEKPSSMSQIQYSPVARLIELYGTIGRKQDARDLLNKQVSGKEYANWDPQYAAYLHVQNSIWAGQQFLKMECPLDAVRVFRKLSDDRALVEQAGQRYGNRPEYYVSQVDRGLKDATAALVDVNADEAMSQLLSVADDLPGGASALDLMLMVPKISDLRARPMQSPLVDLLAALSKEPAIADGIRARLAELREEYPEDLSIGIAQSAYLIRMKREPSDVALLALLTSVALKPLEEVKPGRRPNARQRRGALAQVPLWLVARECLKTKERREIGITLGQRALEAARRQSEDQHSATILYDWGKIALERDDRERAEAKWSELLDIVTRRPERKSPPPKPKTSSSLDRRSIRRPDVAFSFVSFQEESGEKPQTTPRPIPPLRISQFRVSMEIAMAAAENGMPELSRKAVRASMLGGIPVTDVALTQNSRYGGYGGAAMAMPAVPSGSSPGTDSGLSKNEIEVAESLRKVIAKWQGDDYPPEEVYQLLVPIIFPENRPADILMYADSSKLQEAQISSLGAIVVRYSQRAEQLDDLTARIDARKQYPQSKVGALVMGIRIALVSGRLDDAKRALDELAQLIQNGALPPMVQLACHAALPATEHEDLQEPAYAILKAAVNLQLQAVSAKQSSSSADLSLGGLASKVNRYLANEPEEVKKFFENYLAGRQSYYARYSGTYGLYLQWSDWASIAEEAAKAGVSSVALDYIGRVADFSYEGRTRPSTTTAMAVVCREMSGLPPQKRYEAWRDWTLPVEGRQTVRLAAAWVEPVRVPKQFLETAHVQGRHHTGDLLSNFTELLAAADESGRSDDLRSRAKAAHDQELENASFLYALILIQLGDLETGKQVIAPIIDTMAKRLKPQSGQPRPDAWGDYLVYRACLQSPQFGILCVGRKNVLQSGLRSIAARNTLAHLNDDFSLRASHVDRMTVRPGDDPEMAHWFPATTKKQATHGVEPWWIVQEGHIVHLAGAGDDLLYFAYPLTGEFEFTVDAFKGPWAETDAGYGGIVVNSQGSSSRTSVWSTGGHESVNLPKALHREANTFGTVTVKVADGKMQYILNNHVVYEEELSGTSPWITLFTEFGRETTFRNPRFTGTPTIPREVVLVNGDRMDGWNCSFFAESQPRHRIMAQTPKSENDVISHYQRQEPAEHDWRAQDGLLLGRARGDGAKTQSWVYYHRPLRDRESFSYDFYYVPGTSVAHPTIGRIALFLEPQGVHEHWITRVGWDDAVLGLTDDNRLSAPKARRGPRELPLKSADWNRVVLTLADQTVQVTLNDELIYQRILEPELDHRFGLFRGAAQSLKVREPKLTGPWPDSLSPEIRDNLLASTKRYTIPDRRNVNGMLPELIFQQDTGPMVALARRLPPEQAYEKLLAWVLPSAEHNNLRLYHEFVRAEETGRQDIVCPAYELMAAADRAGKLDELDKAIDNLKPVNDLSKRGKIALEALLAMHTGDLDTARQGMAQLHEYLVKGLKKTMSVRDRSIELVVAWQAMKHSALQFAALDMAAEMRDKQRDKEFQCANKRWGESVHILVGHVDGTMLGRSFDPASKPALTQWVNVPRHRPQLRAKGYQHTDWLYMPGVVQHIPGGAYGQLFFQSPLRGNFEIVAERSFHGHREVAIAYGMHAAEPRWDYKAKRITQVMHSSHDVDGEIKIPRQREWLADFRIVVKDDRVTTFVNGVQLHEETLSPRPDPWLVLQAAQPGNSSSVRNLRIIGNPEIPDEIDLIDVAGWGAWRADIYGESFSIDDPDNTTAPWKKVGDEIHGQIRQSVSAAYIESLLMYQRPMLEDGLIEFESFHVTGEFEVHPAVGRTALIVGPDGVRKHTLTDAQYDTSGLSPGNVSGIDGAAGHVELKEEDWNHYSLSLKGERLTLTVNDVDVATVILTEPSNQRYFGLFRYGNRTKCRVRNLIYRGNWPKTLPPVERQQLARASSMRSPEEWSEPTVLPLNLSAEELEAAGLKFGGPPDRVTNVDRGTRMLLKEADGGSSWPSIHFQGPLDGDWVITLDFEDLKFTPAKTGWSSTFALRAVVDQETGISVESGLDMSLAGVKHLRSKGRHKLLSGDDKHDVRFVSTTFDRGRLRLVRDGSLIATYFAETGSDEFHLMEMYPVGHAPVEDIIVQCSGSDSATVIDVVVTQLTIQTRNSRENGLHVETK